MCWQSFFPWQLLEKKSALHEKHQNYVCINHTLFINRMCTVGTNHKSQNNTWTILMKWETFCEIVFNSFLLHVEPGGMSTETKKQKSICEMIDNRLSHEFNRDVQLVQSNYYSFSHIRWRFHWRRSNFYGNVFSCFAERLLRGK